MAKLPPPDDAAKAKAAEAAAKAAWQAKVDAYQLCKAQDKVAAQYKKTAGKPRPRTPSQPRLPAPAAQPAAQPRVRHAGRRQARRPPCPDPGPFAYNPPEQKPLETSGAHSPTGTAASPPSVKPPNRPRWRPPRIALNLPCRSTQGPGRKAALALLL